MEVTLSLSTGLKPGVNENAFRARYGLQQLPHILHWPAQDSAITALDNGPLNQIRMFDHQRDKLGVVEVALGQPEFAIDRLARSQELARRDLHLSN